MPKEFAFRGYTIEQLKQMSIQEFSKLLTAKERRSLLRGISEQERKFLEKIKKEPDKFHKTHLRDMIILPQMVGAKIGVYRGGKAGEEGAWVSLVIKPEMVGHRLGEFAIPIKKVKHSAPGIGASKATRHYATVK
jgi:small subunit ribosomal protein S19